MSLRGRYVIDRIKHTISNRLRLPVPPYGDPGYWDAAYRSFGPQDSFEWGDVSLSDVLQYEYRPIHWNDGVLPKWSSIQSNSGQDTRKSSLGEALGVYPETSNVTNMDENDSGSDADSDSRVIKDPILMLGCGNSKLGEEMITQGNWKGPIVQTDVSSRVIDSMSQRCSTLIENGHMNFVQDDATELSAFRNNMMAACLDKGLLDAVYCADELDQCRAVLKSVHRVLCIIKTKNLLVL